MQELFDFANDVANWVGRFLLAFAAIGALTMAIIETIKELTPIRPWFQRRALRQWLGLPPASQTAAGSKKAIADDATLEQLIDLATAGDAAALFALDTERLAGQLNAAATLALDYPKEYRSLLKRLAPLATDTDMEALGKIETVNLEHVRQHDPKKFNELLGGKARISHQVQRRIDAFQISTSFRWKWWLQLASFAISFVLAAIGLEFGDDTTGFNWATFFGSLPVAVAAGFLAPIARDLIAVIDSARRRK